MYKIINAGFNTRWSKYFDLELKYTGMAPYKLDVINSSLKRFYLPNGHTLGSEHLARH